MNELSKFAQAFGSSNVSKDARKKSKMTITTIPQPEEESFVSKSIIFTICNGKAYFPTKATGIDGFRFDIEPIHISSLEKGDISKNIKRAIEHTPNRISDEESLKLLHSKKPKDQPILRVTDSSSFLNLKRKSISYCVSIQNNGTEWKILFHNPKENFFSSDLAQTFPIDTPIEKLVEVILEDSKKYPHALTSS